MAAGVMEGSGLVLMAVMAAVGAQQRGMGDGSAHGGGACMQGAHVSIGVDDLDVYGILF
jgi:hypothetical protein